MVTICLEDAIYLEPPYASYDTLIVKEWDESSWVDDCKNGFLNLCNLLKIKKIIFETKKDMFGVISLAWTLILPAFATPELPFLPHLRKIHSFRDQWHFVLTDLITHSRIRELSWYGNCMPQVDYSTIERIYISLRRERSKVFDHNCSIQRIKFFSEKWGPKLSYIPVHIDKHASNIRLTHEARSTFDECARWMEYNVIGWENCKSAIVIVSGLCKKQKIVNRDMIKMITTMIWETRGTKVWTE
uniref:Uncharacterized protein n=1 Tax=viral metagenome TaxID=1070528 RepID=A0A6C0CGM9_9ZZZZ